MAGWIGKKSGWLGNKKARPQKEGKEEKGEPDYAVSFVPVRCPHCRSVRAVKCYKTTPPVRYHKCRSCGFNFKSVEMEGGKL